MKKESTKNDFFSHMIPSLLQESKGRELTHIELEYSKNLLDNKIMGICNSQRGNQKPNLPIIRETQFRSRHQFHKLE